MNLEDAIKTIVDLYPSKEEKEEETTTSITINPKYYHLANIRKIAGSAGIKNQKQYNKRQLCEMLGLEFKVQNRDGHKHSLTNLQTGQVEEFKSANSIATKFNVNPNHIFYRVTKQIPLVVDGVSYMVKKTP